MAFRTNNSEAMRIDSNGKVGINNTDPTAYYSDNLVVGSADEGGITLVSGATTHKAYILWADGTSGDAAYRGSIAYDHNTDKLSMGSAAQTERLVIDSSGRVGIGTTSPSGTLHVQMSHTSTDVTAANSNETLVLGNSGTGNGVYNAIKFGGNQQDMYIMSFNNSAQANRRMGFFLGSVAGDAVADERLSITGEGKVLIGTSDSATTSSAGLVISSNAVGNNALNGALSLRGNGGDFYAENWTTTQAGTNGAGFGRLAAFSPTTDYLATQYRTGGSSNNVLIQYFDGDVTISGTLTENSDVKLKKDIKDLPSQLENIKQLRPVTYTKKATDKSEIGFIAQEVETVYAKEFTESKEQPTGEHDSDGNVLKEEIKVLSYARLTAVLTKAIQEQQEQIEQLKTEIQTLKGE